MRHKLYQTLIHKPYHPLFITTTATTDAITDVAVVAADATATQILL